MIWFLYLPIAILTYILCLITNPIVILFCDEDGELHGLLHLWQTWDDSTDSMYFMTSVCPKWLDYDYHKHYECQTAPVEGNRTRLVSISKGVPFTLVERLQRYVCRLWWLTRNAAYGFAYYWLGKDIKGTNTRTVYKDEYTGFYINDETNTWMLTSEQPIIKGLLRWEVFLGWKIWLGSSERMRTMIAIRCCFRFR